MNSKQECIAKAYFDLFKEVSNADKEKRFNGIKNFIDDYGWLSGTLHDVDKNLIEFSGHEIRPKSLQGIENNNGWVKIESEEDLPKETDSYFVTYKDGSVICHHFSTHSDFDRLLFLDEMTHYQPITKPTPPLH